VILGNQSHDSIALRYSFLFTGYVCFAFGGIRYASRVAQSAVEIGLNL